MKWQLPFYTYKLQLLHFAHALLKYKLNEHFKRAYKVLLFSKAKSTHLGPTQPSHIPRKSGSLSKKLWSRGVKLSALFNDDVCTALVTDEWTSTEQRWIDTDDRKPYRKHTCSNATFITTNPTGNSLGLNPRLCSERLDGGTVKFTAHFQLQ